MAYNFLACDRDQVFLLPPDVRDWLPGWLRADVGQASRPARNDLAPVAIVDRNEHAEKNQRDFCNRLVRVNGLPAIYRTDGAGELPGLGAGMSSSLGLSMQASEG